MNENYRSENIVNISMRAAELLKAGKIERDDISGHAGLTEVIVNLAEVFEEKYANVDWNAADAPDYWEEIDKFAEEQLMERYGIEARENTVKLWARVGMTLEVTQETYERLKTGDRTVLQAVFDGTAGHARLDGETYFPDIEQNVGLEDMEFDLPVSSPKQAQVEPPVLGMNDPVKVYAVAGSVKQEVFSGTLDACNEFCNTNGWAYEDENEFVWDLELEDTRDLPLGYFDAVTHFSDYSGRDMDNEFAREHAAALVYCYENHIDLLDFDFWTQYESLLGDKITFDEYMHIDSLYDGDPLDLKAEDHAAIAALKGALIDLRASSPDKGPTLDDMIHSAEGRKTQQGSPAQSKSLRYNMDDTIITYENYNGGVNNLAGTGEIKINGQLWSARSFSDDQIIPVGAKVVIGRIEGSYMYVGPAQ